MLDQERRKELAYKKQITHIGCTLHPLGFQRERTATFHGHRH